MYRRSGKFVSIRLASLANIFRICSLLSILAVGSAKADDLLWGSTDGLNTSGFGGIAYDKIDKLSGPVYSPGSGSDDSYDPSTEKCPAITSQGFFGASSQGNVIFNPAHLQALNFVNGSNHSYSYDFSTQGTPKLGSILGAGGHPQSLAAVPEPSIGVMFGLGLLGLLGFQRWRRSSVAR
jgi:hypothetical protein